MTILPHSQVLTASSPSRSVVPYVDKMAGLRWVLWETHLWVLFLGWLMLGSAAISIDEASCDNLWQYDSSGDRVIYGRKLNFLVAALNEARDMVINANETFERVRETVIRGDKDWESLKIKVLFTDLQGQSDKRKYFVETYRWKRVLGGIPKLFLEFPTSSSSFLPLLYTKPILNISQATSRNCTTILNTETEMIHQ